MPAYASYQQQDCPLTLAEALEEYFARNPGLTKVEPGEPSAELFLPHDCCHVVFGLGTSMVEEAMADIWTIAGSDVGLRRYLGFMKYIGELEPVGIVKSLGWKTIVGHSLASIPLCARAWWRGKRLPKKWGWDEYENYMNVPLKDIRAECGIRLIRAPEWALQASSVMGDGTQIPEPAAESAKLRSA